MSINNRIKLFANVIRHVLYVSNVQKLGKSENGQLMGEIIRNVHSIEKGLSLEKPRKLFGHAKILDMLLLVERYKRLKGHSKDVIIMAYDALNEYLLFHTEELNTPEIIEIRNLMATVFSDIDIPIHEKHGGTISIVKNNNEESFAALEKVINSRHSIRDFSKEEVPMETLRKAINAALRCPSACNRQGTRVYIISGAKKSFLSDWVTGIGGFGDSIEKYIIITGKLSEYREDEQFQYLVSSCIFAGYLTLTLEAANIGSCVIQRPVLFCKKWKKLQKELSIPEDEQIVLMIGIGMKKEVYKVPVSYRLQYEDLVKEFY